MHTFREPPRVPAHNKGTHLAKNAFKMDVKQESLPFRQIQSSKQSPDYYSPSAQSVPVGTADNWSTRHCWSAADLNLINSCWHGGLFHHAHRVAFSFKDKKQFIWVAMRHFSDSAVLCWPVSIKAIPRTPFKCVIPDFSIAKPCLKTITDVDDIVCWHFAYKS